MIMTVIEALFCLLLTLRANTILGKVSAVVVVADTELGTLESRPDTIATASSSVVSDQRRRLSNRVRSFEMSITFDNFINFVGEISIKFDGNNRRPIGVITLNAPANGEIATFRYCLDASGATEIIPATTDEEDQFLKIVVTPCVCVCGVTLCFDPHLQGLRGQHIEWTGVDGGWYALVKDDDDDLQINVRTTSPLPDDFPERGFITGLSVLSQGHSLIVEVTDPYSTSTVRCPANVSPCLADGGLSIFVDGKKVDSLTGATNDVHLPGGIELAAFNLPPECREIGGRKVWARAQKTRGGRRRQLAELLSFEEWMFSFENMVSPEYCTMFVTNDELSRVQSDQALVRIITPTVVVRLGVGINERLAGKMDRFGRDLPAMEFWQMSVGVDGLSLERESLSGLLGETARVVVDAEGYEATEGVDSIPGTVEDYRVSDAEGVDFDLLH